MNENEIIKQKDTEIDILILKNERLKDEVSELRAENERLKNSDAVSREYVSICDKEIEDWKSLCNDYKSELLDVAKRIKHIASEARKEFAERLKLIIVLDLCEAIDCSEYLNDILPEKIDKLLAEMESERE